MKTVATAGMIENRIYFIRGQKVMLDSDLAELYGVATKVLVQAVKRNAKRFPEDFMFQLANQDVPVLRSQIVTSSSQHGGRRYLPYVFTEHGAIMAASMLNSDRAIEVSIHVVRAFVRLREMIATHKDLASKLEKLEKRYDAQFKVVFDAFRELMIPPSPQQKKIGFIRERQTGYTATVNERLNIPNNAQIRPL